MQSILQNCEARSDIITGSFNPEIFTASLSQVMDFYRGKQVIAHPLYTDGEEFFGEGTYPTEGLRMVVRGVFGRLAGDNSYSAIHRLETAFGGGKTHTLISLAHLGFRGRELASSVSDIIDEEVLPSPKEVKVVGIAGERIPVHKPHGTELIPYTLWGEIAYQIGAEDLYRNIESDATSHAAPGEAYFDKVFSGHKVLLMLDELAQYAARLEAARPNGADQLAAFLMALHGYARTHSGIAVVLTLASQRDAFATQTKLLTGLISKVRGEEINENEALGIAERAQSGIGSVVARDAAFVVPVHAAEISRVLAKRLFTGTDREAAQSTANDYVEMYRKTSASLPDRASQMDFREMLLAHYPFHPTFIEFLNSKLSTVENFQGTRGVLRVLAYTIRSIWRKKKDIPMIHTCHMDLRDTQTIDEILGRTGSGDLLPVLNTDVGGADSGTLVAGRSYAEQADRKNPHPAGYPLHEYAWKTVFLHSLVGRAEGLSSNLFGITERDALFEVAFPGMSPPQVETALREIENSAQYLRYSQGRYYASLEPSENRALSSIRQALGKNGPVAELLAATARKVVTADVTTFKVVHDVRLPEHVPDKTKQPVLALVDLAAREIDAEEFVTTVGTNRPRLHQNLVFLLVPETVHVKGEIWNEDRVMRSQEIRNRLEEMARNVVAMRRLLKKPEDYGIPASKISDRFRTRHKERENALLTTVTQVYSNLWFPSASGQIVRKEIKTGGGEGGTSVIEEIKRILRTEGELITSDMAGTQEAILTLGSLFFATDQTPTLTKIRENFACVRRWPVLEQPTVLDQLIRAGVARNKWCLFRMGSAENVKPAEFYGPDSGELPLELDLSQPDWSIVTVQGATQREWTGRTPIDEGKIEKLVIDEVAQKNSCYIVDVAKAVSEKIGEVP